jgi:hypothetical protein
VKRKEREFYISREILEAKRMSKEVKEELN